MAHLRSRTGCWTCRFRKKKCEEDADVCNNCRKLRIICDHHSRAQPLYMRDSDAAAKKRIEIKAQMGKITRRRRRTSIPSSQDLQSVISEQTRSANSLIPYQALPIQHLKSPAPAPVTVEELMKLNLEYGLIEKNVDNVAVPIVEMKGLISPPRSPQIDIPVQETDKTPKRAYRCPPTTAFAKFTIIQDNQPRSIGYDDRIVRFLAADLRRSSMTPSETFLYASVLSLKSVRELRLIQHYIYDVCRYTYKGMPKEALELLLRQALIPRCKASDPFRQGCISSGALHVMSTTQIAHEAEELKNETMNYRGRALNGLQRYIAGSEDGYSEDVLGTIVILATYDINSASAQWKCHLDAAIDCIVNLDVLNRTHLSVGLSFLTRRVVWLDILSSCTTGRKPELWLNYRYILTLDRHRMKSLKVHEIVGVADEVLFLMSEVHCLEEYWNESLNKPISGWATGQRCATELDDRLQNARPERYQTAARKYLFNGMELLRTPSSSQDMLEHIYPERDNCNYIKISDAITAAFIAAIRIHMWSLGVGLFPRLDVFRNFLAELIAAVRNVPDDHIRCILYPLLVGGSLACEEKTQSFFRKRFILPEPCGILRRVQNICEEVWVRRDELEQIYGISGAKEVHWRKVMWDLGYNILFV